MKSGSQSETQIAKQKMDKNIKELAIEKIIEKYHVDLLSCVNNTQNTTDVELSHNIYFKEQEKMEVEIRELGNINDIYYRDVD